MSASSDSVLKVCTTCYLVALFAPLVLVVVVLFLGICCLF
jgi:hypothetical protein